LFDSSIESLARGLSPETIPNKAVNLSPSDFAVEVSRGLWRTAPHLEMLSDKLLQVANGEIKRLIVETPPRHGKSSLISHWFPVWYLEQWPRRHIILCSYEADFAGSWGRLVRNTVLENEDTLSLRLAADSKAGNRWHTQQGGGMVTAGVGGAITGRGANCLPAGTMITTEIGLIAIENLQCVAPSVKILAYDTEKGRLEYRQAQAFSRSVTDGVYRITTSSGRVVSATAEHLFWTNRGYLPAAALTSCDTLLSLVSTRVSEASVSNVKEHNTRAQRRLLFRGVFRKSPCNQEQAAVSPMRRACSKENKGLLRKVPLSETGTEDCLPSTGSYLSDLQQHFFGQMEGEEIGQICNLLQPVLCSARTFAVNVRQRQSQMEKWSNATSRRRSFSESLSANEASHKRERQMGLCGLRQHDKVTCAPYRQLADEQLWVESGNSLCLAPSAVASPSGIRIVPDRVARLEYLHEETIVFDLQVEQLHNFFANGILVHNCLIIDDPVKNAADANSPTYQDAAWQWFKSTAYTRLEPQGAIVIVQTRWHREDLAGKLIAEMEQGGEHWEVLKMPAIAEENDQLGRTPGDPLWPERYDLDALANIKNSVGSYVWSALYQQSPLPPGGLLFNREWFEVVDAVPDKARRVRAWDMAATEAIGKGDPDYTAGCGMARSGGTFYIYDMRRARLSPLGVENLIKQTAATDGKAVHISMEQEPGASGKASIDYYTRALAGYVFRGIPASGSKTERARPLAAQAEAGNVKIVRGAWNKEFLDEIELFPGGGHDDQNDSASLAFDMLCHGGSLIG
jgi:predicted phage terminase large subunit-like protein